ncbi:MAG: choice-of-anchor tandem repeat GloVer-containing protein [Bryobacteraceae bacterium]|jgi:uncharacterized repeat protein (TIGR03803 family)
MQRALIVCLLCVAATASSAQTLTVLANFDYTDGSSPLSRLVQGLDGKLYGTTSEGGAGFYGTVFAFSAAGQIATLHSFAVADGAYPDTALVQAPNGNFYSTTNEGGSKGCGGFGCGTVFSITPRGKLTPLHIFDGTDGLLPEGLLEASNGNFYGFTDQGGPASACTVGCGTIFKVTPAGKFSTVLNFDGADGDLAAGVLVQGADGDYYGTTFGGGAEGIGTIFKITPAGTLTTLYSFCRCASGYGPDAGLVETANGDFYGTTSMGGTYGFGTIFKFTASGALTGLYSFDALDGPAALVVATDGNLYGTTIHGGTSSECVGNCGFIYRMTPAGEFTTLFNFDSTNGPSYAGLLQATDGNFYGTSYDGGTTGDGVIFRFSVGLGPFVKTLPAAGTVGATVHILGTDLTGPASVAFNGVPAAVTSLSASEIVTTVPAGATTGKVTVTIPSGMLTSNVAFQVRP